MLSKEEELHTAIENLRIQIDQVHVLFDMLEVQQGTIEWRILMYERSYNDPAS